MSREPKPTSKTRRKRLRVGDRVSFRLGQKTAVGTVVEDSGNLAPGGKQLVRVEVVVDETYHAAFDVAIDEATRLEAA